jgi:hypothetical protein
LFSSTHLASPECPPRPDHSKGYVWPLHTGYDVFAAKIDDSRELERLTDTPGYDAEATVCAKDGAIVFTSVRDGDLELYRMDRDGKNVVRLTNEPGYDGGAFFSNDCSKIVWRASRPEGAALDDYRKLLANNLVRPTQLELWVANADGSDARQVTHLGAASFAPYFFPDGKRIIFSSNYGDPNGREFELWAVDVDGSRLERITYSPGFDGFPMFSPDGRWLAFGSNRATPKGKRDTNVFVARWIDGDVRSVPERPADRVRADVGWLAAPEREGRGVGTKGLEIAGAWIEQRFVSLGLVPGMSQTSYRQPFELKTALLQDASTRVEIAGRALDAGSFQALSFSASGEATGELVFAEHGVVWPKDKIDDYAGVAVKDKIVVVRRSTPRLAAGDPHDSARRRDSTRKAELAEEKGARALIIVDVPTEGDDGDGQEAPFPPLMPMVAAKSIPVMMLNRATGAGILAQLKKRERIEARLAVKLVEQTASAFNVAGRLPANAPEKDRRAGVVVIGAHYDHLGYGGHGSLDPDSRAAHLGADDNASGVAALFETARLLQTGTRRRDVLFVAFSGEERGVLGSAHFVRQLPTGVALGDVVAMLNMDMVGRLRGNHLQALGGESAAEWPSIVQRSCEQARIRCSASGNGYGPSDHTTFFAAGVPVLHFFTGAHSDYHRPSDSPELVHAAGVGQVASAVAAIALAVSERDGKLSYRSAPEPPPESDVRASRSSLGTIPDYGGPPSGQKGVLLSGVRKGGPADAAGVKRGDILVRLGPHAVDDVHGLMFALAALLPGDKIKATVLREGKKLELDVVMGRASSRH